MKFVHDFGKPMHVNHRFMAQIAFSSSISQEFAHRAKNDQYFENNFGGKGLNTHCEIDSAKSLLSAVT